MRVIKMNNCVLCIISIAIVGCGIKGNPLPPITAAQLGTGSPNYQEASREILKSAPTNGKKLENIFEEDLEEEKGDE
jgi:hypothetical protein